MDICIPLDANISRLHFGCSQEGLPKEGVPLYLSLPMLTLFMDASSSSFPGFVGIGLWSRELQEAHIYNLEIKQ